mgnify:FL=1
MKMNNNFGNSLFMDNESIGDNSINYTEFGFSINNNNNYFNNKNNNIMNSNNNLLLSANNSEINLKDIKDINIKDEEEKK